MIHELYTLWKQAADEFAVISADGDAAFVAQKASALATIEAEFVAAYCDIEYGGGAKLGRRRNIEYAPAETCPTCAHRTDPKVAIVDEWELFDGSKILSWQTTRFLRSSTVDRRAAIPAFTIVPATGPVIVNGWILDGFDADRYRARSRRMRSNQSFWGPGADSVFATYA